MNRYLFELSYLGTNYSGWQSQINANTIQDEIEKALSQILNTKISIVGCGRTDAGVHANQSFFHADLPQTSKEDNLVFILNKVLPKDISIQSIQQVKPNFHARFDAMKRSYTYYISNKKLAFLQGQYWHYRYTEMPDISLLSESAQLLLKYSEFFPFSKTNTDVKTYKCTLSQIEWQQKDHLLIFNISSNRFLRGMVRLIVGMGINYATGKIDKATIEECMQEQKVLPRAFSVPAEGLFLNEVIYPDQ